MGQRMFVQMDHLFASWTHRQFWLSKWGSFALSADCGTQLPLLHNSAFRGTLRFRFARTTSIPIKPARALVLLRVEVRPALAGLEVGVLLGLVVPLPCRAATKMNHAAFQGIRIRALVVGSPAYPTSVAYVAPEAGCHAARIRGAIAGLRA